MTIVGIFSLSVSKCHIDSGKQAPKVAAVGRGGRGEGGGGIDCPAARYNILYMTGVVSLLIRSEDI